MVINVTVRDLSILPRKSIGSPKEAPSADAVTCDKLHFLVVVTARLVSHIFRLETSDINCEEAELNFDRMAEDLPILRLM